MSPFVVTSGAELAPSGVPRSPMAAKEAIQGYLHEAPGASTQMIARHLDIDPSTADYHLRRLRKEGAVLKESSGREVVWFAAGSGLCPVLRAAIPAFRRADIAAVATELGEFPRTSTWLSRETGVPVGRVRWAVDVLIAIGVAVKTNTGRIELAPGAATCVAQARAAAPCVLWGKCAPSRKEK